MVKTIYGRSGIIGGGAGSLTGASASMPQATLLDPRPSAPAFQLKPAGEPAVHNFSGLAVMPITTCYSHY
ncbi:MAG: hypothetical protein ACRD01_08715 [Terriglobales bacterium]